MHVVDCDVIQMTLVNCFSTAIWLNPKTSCNVNIFLTLYARPALVLNILRVQAARSNSIKLISSFWFSSSLRMKTSWQPAQQISFWRNELWEMKFSLSGKKLINSSREPQSVMMQFFPWGVAPECLLLPSPLAEWECNFGEIKAFLLGEEFGEEF